MKGSDKPRDPVQSLTNGCHEHGSWTITFRSHLAKKKLNQLFGRKNSTLSRDHFRRFMVAVTSLNRHTPNISRSLFVMWLSFCAFDITE